MLNLKAVTPLTKEELRAKAKSIFAEKGSSTTSEKYAHISTEKIIDDIALLGWGAIDAKEVKTRKEIYKGYQKHLVIFRNPDVVIVGDDGDDIYPQILLTNSHDGKNKFVFKTGIFRTVCENGLVVSTKEFDTLKLRHYGYSFEELQTIVNDIVSRLPLTVDSINTLQSIQLEQEQILEFAYKALEARFDKDELETIEVDLDELVKPTRPQDEGNNMWSVYNVVQEKITSGSFDYTYGTKTRKARKIKNFNQDILINERLFELALSYIQPKEELVEVVG